MDLLWPEFGPSSATNQLRKALHVARQNLRSGDEHRPVPIVRQDDLIAAARDEFARLGSRRAERNAVRALSRWHDDSDLTRHEL